MNLIKQTIVLVIMVFHVGLVGASSHQKDKGKDHPLIERFPGTYIQKYYTSQYDEFMVATGPVDSLKSKEQLPPVKRYEGKITTIKYVAKTRENSVLQVSRNYQKALKKLQAKEIFSCSNDVECGKKFITQLYWYGDAKRRQLGMFDAPNTHGKNADYFYWSGSKNVKGKTYIINLVVARRFTQPVEIVLDVNEVDTLDTDQIGISVDFDTLTTAIDNEGKVVLEGIFFDTNKTDIKPESKAVVDVLVEYLKTFPAKKFYVVGHTDSDGTYDFNINLSQGRAETIVKELVKSSIDKTRLMPLGVGPISPVAKNNSESGKALNRRVELVEM